MIIGITGTLGAGKGTVVGFLRKRGFVHFSVRDFLVEEIRRRGLSEGRDSMVLVANDLRARFGASYIVEELYRRAVARGGDVVIESIRCVGEVEALRKKSGFVLWAVDADVESRYTRIVERGSSTDKISFQEFVEQESVEMSNVDKGKQDLKGCIDLADHVFRNDWTIAELEGKVERVLDGISKKAERVVRVRPSWDEYFMKMAALVAERSTCLRHNIGAVIVRDRRVVATGYNGSVRGAVNCVDEGFCLKNKMEIASGAGHEVCHAVHAEQNAIIQGALHGICVDGATMYCTHTPCGVCAKIIVNAGIKRVVSYHDYSDDLAREFLRSSGVVLDKVERPSGEIEFVD